MGLKFVGSATSVPCSPEVRGQMRTSRSFAEFRMTNLLDDAA